MPRPLYKTATWRQVRFEPELGWAMVGLGGLIREPVVGMNKLVSLVQIGVQNRVFLAILTT